MNNGQGHGIPLDFMYFALSRYIQIPILRVYEFFSNYAVTMQHNNEKLIFFIKKNLFDQIHAIGL